MSPRRSIQNPIARTASVKTKPVQRAAHSTPIPRAESRPPVSLAEVRQQLHEQLITLPVSAFEQLIAHLLTVCGYGRVQVLAASTRGLATSQSPSAHSSNEGAQMEPITTAPIGARGGADLCATLEQGLSRMVTLVQVKQYHTPVSRRFVDELRGAMLRTGAQHGLLVTTSTFYGPALQAVMHSSAWPVRLMEGSELLDRLLEHRFGVQRKSSRQWQLDAGFWQRLSNGQAVAWPTIITCPNTFSPQDAGSVATTPNDKTVATPKRKRLRRKRSASLSSASISSPSNPSTGSRLWSGWCALWHCALWRRFYYPGSADPTKPRKGVR